MKKKEDDLRSGVLKMRISKNERQQIHKLRKKTTEKYLSNYARKVLLNEPVTFVYRNKSVDDFTAEMLLVKKDLHYIGHNFNQAVHKLHTLEKIPDFRDWIIQSEAIRNAFMQKVEEISIRMHQIQQQWLQE